MSSYDHLRTLAELIGIHGCRVFVSSTLMGAGMGENPLPTLLTVLRKGRYWLLCGRLIYLRPQGLQTLRDSEMVSNKQAPGRGTRAFVQAAILASWQQGNAASRNALKRVSRPEVFLGKEPACLDAVGSNVLPSIP